MLPVISRGCSPPARAHSHPAGGAALHLLAPHIVAPTEGPCQQSRGAGSPAWSMPHARERRSFGRAQILVWLLITRGSLPQDDIAVSSCLEGLATPVRRTCGRRE